MRRVQMTDDKGHIHVKSKIPSLGRMIPTTDAGITPIISDANKYFFWILVRIVPS
jgi:hypothetical protein